jgi:hypothetical protein
VSFLFLRAYFMLISFELLLVRNSFANLHHLVRSCPVSGKQFSQTAVSRICSAVDVACIWYWKEVLCLQRSAVTTCLLKRAGVPAQMIIGARMLPFRAHAWVEVGGNVVNDKSDVPEIYAVVDRC